MDTSQSSIGTPIPALDNVEFRPDLADYRNDAEAYEIEERSRPDEMEMLRVAGEHAKQFLNTRRNARVVDLCCGTGLSMEQVVDHPCVDCVVGVDISPEYLAFAAAKYAHAQRPPDLRCSDVLLTPLPKRHFDLAVLASAYHHVEDHRKVPFLRRVYDTLTDDGLAIFAENILPDYVAGDFKSYCDAVRLFYTEVLKTAIKSNPLLPKHVRELIARVAKYGCDGDYEYKVSYSIFRSHLQESGLKVMEEHLVWPFNQRPLTTHGGNYVILARKGCDD